MSSKSTFAKFALGFSAAAFAIAAFGATAGAANDSKFKFKKFNRDRQIVISNDGAKGNAGEPGQIDLSKKKFPTLVAPKSDIAERRPANLVAPKSEVADLGGGGKPAVIFSSRPKSDVAENVEPARVKKLRPSNFQVVDVTPKRAIKVVRQEPSFDSNPQELVISKSDPVETPVFASAPKKLFKIAKAPVAAFVDPTAASGSALALADTDQAQQLKDLGIDPSQLEGVNPGDKIVIEIREEKVKAQPKVRYVYEQAAPVYGYSESSGYNSYHPAYVGQSYSNDSYDSSSNYSSSYDNCEQ